jgi:hypothetical protein
MTPREQTIATLTRLGFDQPGVSALLRCSATLHTWSEHCCNGAIQRDEETGKPYWYSAYACKRLGPARDAEAGALKQANAIAARQGFSIYHQGDPRGCSLYLYRPEDLTRIAERHPTVGELVCIESYYNSIGTAVVP